MSEEATVTTTTPATETAPVTTQATAPATEAAAPVATEPAKVENPSWYEKFPTKYRNNGEPDVDKLIEGYDHLQKKLSSKGWAPPSDVAEYGDAAPKSYDVDPEAFDAFRHQAQELGINKDAFGKLIELHDSEIARLMPPVEVTEEHMKQHWGRDYDNNLASANRAFKEFIDPSINANHPAFQTPEVLKLLANIGAQLGEDTQSTPASIGKSGTSYDEIQAIMKSEDYYNNREKQAQVTAWYAKHR